MLNLTAIPELRARLLAAQEEEARAILTVAVGRIPKETETAAHSGRTVTEGDTTYITFGRDDDHNPKTGQPSNSYIEALEEDSERHHPNGQSHFLRSAGDDAVSGLAERIAGKARI
jgi:hypothetical protein